MDSLKKFRDRIDMLDEQIASLLNERMRAADQIGKLKRKAEQGVADRSREEDVIHHVEMVAQHPVLKADIGNIYNEIMKESRISQLFSRNLSMPFRRVGIIGLGLIGGSICKGIKTKDRSIHIAALFHAEDKKDQEDWIDHTYSTVAELVQNVDLLILASPISTILPYADAIAASQARDENLVIIDVASVKGEIVNHFEKLTTEKIDFIGTHPMSGKVTLGFSNSQATLFVDRPWVITAHDKNTASNIEKIVQLIQFLGADPVCLDAKTHDRQAALISHLPFIISKSYLNFVNSTDPESLKIAGPGFQSFTRIAHANSTMHQDILKENSALINGFLEEWMKFLHKNT